MSTPAPPTRFIQIFDKRVEREYVSETGSFSEFATRLRAGDLVVPNISLIEPLAVEIQHFADCIEGRAEPRASGQQGLDVVCVLEAASKSMKEDGRPVKVRYR